MRIFLSARSKSHHVIRRNDVFHDVTVLLQCCNQNYLNCVTVLTTGEYSSASDLRHHWKLPGPGCSDVTGSVDRMIEQGDVGLRCRADVLNFIAE